MPNDVRILTGKHMDVILDAARRSIEAEHGPNVVMWPDDIRAAFELAEYDWGPALRAGAGYSETDTAFGWYDTGLECFANCDRLLDRSYPWHIDVANGRIDKFYDNPVEARDAMAAYRSHFTNTPVDLMIGRMVTIHA